MQDIFKKRVTLETILITVLLIIFGIAFSMYFYNESVSDASKWGVFLGGLAASLIVVLIQILLSWKEYTASQKIRGLGFTDYIKNRKDFNLYFKLLENSNSKVFLLGSTARSFLKHFAGFGNNDYSDNKALIRALDRGVRVRLLISDIKGLPDDKQESARRTHKWLAELKDKYKQTNSFEYKYIKDPLAHSLLRIDGTCIVGPVFREKESRKPPSILVATGSHFGDQYLDYFEDEWENGSVES